MAKIEKKNIGHLTDSLIEDIVSCIVGLLPVERIFLFGSSATSEMTESSDIDLLIVSKTEDPWEDKMMLRKSLRGLGYAFDIVLISPERFLERKDVIGTIIYPAVHFGKVIYERAG
jgi:predicted nucleotidyltransferase